MNIMSPHAQYELHIESTPGRLYEPPAFTSKRRTSTTDGVYQHCGEVRDDGVLLARLDAVYIPGYTDTPSFIKMEDPDGDLVRAWKEYILLLEKGLLTYANNGGVMFLQALSVHPNFRGQRLGLHLLREFMVAFNKSAECFMARPYPLTLGCAISEEERSEGVRKLFRYYGKLGFKRIRPKSRLNMVLSTDRPPVIGSSPWEGDS